MKIRPVGAEFFQADGQTNVTKLVVAFRNFANAPKKCVGEVRRTIDFKQVTRVAKILF